MTTELNKSPPYKPAHGFFHDFQGVDYPINPLCVFRNATGALYSEQHNSAARELEQAAMDISRQRDELADALLDLHRYQQTDFSYLGSPASAKTHRALVSAGYLTEDGTLTAIAKARGQQ
jgi:hypothetical protein